MQRTVTEPNLPNFKLSSQLGNFFKVRQITYYSFKIFKHPLMLWRNDVPIGLMWKNIMSAYKENMYEVFKEWFLVSEKEPSWVNLYPWLMSENYLEQWEPKEGAQLILTGLLFCGIWSWLSLEHKGRGPESIQLTKIAKGEPYLNRNESLRVFVIFLIETCYLCHQCIEVPMINILVLDTNFTCDMVQHQIIVKGIMPGFHWSPSLLLQIDKWMQNQSQSK